MEVHDSVVIIAVILIIWLGGQTFCQYLSKMEGYNAYSNALQSKLPGEGFKGPKNAAGQYGVKPQVV